MPTTLKCGYCDRPLPWVWGSRGEGCHVKHGCLGEVKAYINSHGAAACQVMANAAFNFKTSCGFLDMQPDLLLGYSQPVDWHLCAEWFLRQWEDGHYSYRRWAL